MVKFRFCSGDVSYDSQNSFFGTKVAFIGEYAHFHRSRAEQISNFVFSILAGMVRHIAQKNRVEYEIIENLISM